MQSSRDGEFRRWVVEDMGSSADVKFTRWEVQQMGFIEMRIHEMGSSEDSVL